MKAVTISNQKSGVSKSGVSLGKYGEVFLHKKEPEGFDSRGKFKINTWDYSGCQFTDSPFLKPNMGFAKNSEAGRVSASHLEDLHEVKLEAGDAPTTQQWEDTRAMNYRIVRKVCAKFLNILVVNSYFNWFSMINGYSHSSGSCTSHHILTEVISATQRQQELKKTSG
jgi:hypothetical protein